PGVFSRGMDPTRDRLEDLSEAVRAHGADVGVAYDCDADRVVFVGEDGVKLPADYALLIYLKHLADSGGMKDVVVSVDTSLAVEDIVEGSGCRVVYSKVGEANVVRRMLEEGVSIGGEGSSGGLIISDFNLCRDGVLASMLVAKVVKQFGGLKSVIDGLPKYHSLRERIKCRRGDALRLVKTLAEEEAGDIDTTDGVKIRRRDGSWVLVRPSGTEDIVRISVEAKTEGEASELMKCYVGKISKMLQDGGQG
ncbi:MAG: phosphoglucosamine mutase, partial [Nitrososphaerales archaeon]